MIATMRVLAVCLVFSLAVLLALPETAGAPACGCAKAKAVEAVVGTPACGCAKAKAVKAVVGAPACGCAKAKVGIRANRGVRVKWVTLGSLLARPNRNLGESDVNFYLRIFRFGRSRRTFYGKVFAPFRDESDLDYVNRINFIFTRVYPKLDCRCNRKYADYLEKYYTVLYARQAGESDDAWFTRVLTKTTENEDEYLVKVDLLKQYFANVDWNRVQIDAKSKTGFVLLSSNPSASTRSLDDSDNADSLTEDEIKKYFAKLDSEDVETYYSRIISRLSLRRRYLKNYSLALTTLRRCYPGLAIWYSPKYNSLLKDYYGTLYARLSGETDEQYFQRIVTKENFETDMQCAQRINIIRSLLPNLSLWCNTNYYGLVRNAYQLLYKKLSTEDDTTYFQRITARSADESDSVYFNRLALIKQTCVNLPLWYSKEYLDLTRNFYKSRYTKQTSETDELLFKRIVTKESGETDEQCAKRVGLLHDLFPNLGLWYNTKYYSLTQSFYKTLYQKVETEDEVTYYKRITSRLDGESNSVYVSRLSLLKKNFAHLPLWYSKQHLDVVKNYYITLYTKSSSETEEAMFKRIVTKEDEETDEECVKRVFMVRQCFPNLSLWYDSKYYSLTQRFYQTLYNKLTTEDETTYYQRITARLADESNSVYINRISLIKKTFVNLPVWYNKQYLNLMKNYYMTLYTKSSSETEESLFKRIVTKEDGESDEECVKRVGLVRELTPSLSLWSDAKYYDLTKNFYQISYQKLVNEDDTTYFKRITTKSTEETDQAYVNRIVCIKRTFSGLNLWFSKQYLDFTRSFYTARYAKGSSETDESLFKRIVTKEIEETDDQWAQRVDIVHQCFPNLALWYDAKYYEFAKNFYQTIYKKSSSEDEITYFKRITTRTDQETDAAYLGRLTEIQNTFSSLSLWSSVENLSIVKSYYSLKYAKLAGESDEAYFTRLVAKESCDISDDVYVKRLYLVELLTISSASSLWYDAKYYKFTKTFYELYYKKSDSESCDGWLTRAITLLPGETNDNAIRRISLVKQASGSCGCWTLENLSKVEASKVFSAEYITKIRSSFFPISYKKSSSSSSSSSKAVTAEASESAVEYSRRG